MNTYELILGIDSSLVDELTYKGIFRTNVKRDIEMYKLYVKQLHNGCTKMQALSNVSVDYGVSEDTVRRAIERFKD